MSQTESDKTDKTITELKKIYNLPAMSNVMMEVTKLLDDPSTTTADLSRMISKDQGLSTKVLSIANSPLYGLPRKVSTIDFAIMIIGFQDVKNIVVALSMIEAFKEKEDKDGYQKEFWMHSFLVANTAKRIADDLGFKIGSEAFIAGLLHDLGIVVIFKYFKKEFHLIIESIQQGKNTYAELEIERFGLSHEDIGYILSENWNLPVHLCDAIRNHHRPGRAKQNEIISAIVHLADYIIKYFYNGKNFWDHDLTLDPKTLEVLNFINEDEINKFIESYRELLIQEINTLKV